MAFVIERNQIRVVDRGKQPTRYTGQDLGNSHAANVRAAQEMAARKTVVTGGGEATSWIGTGIPGGAIRKLTAAGLDPASAMKDAIRSAIDNADLASETIAALAKWRRDRKARSEINPGTPENVGG